MTELLYSVERAYPVSLSALWNAWVDSAALEEWYHPTDLSVVPGSVVSDAHPGGLWTVAVDVPAHNFVAYFFGWYAKVDEGRMLEHTLSYTQDESEFLQRDESAPFHTIRVDFETRGPDAWARFSQYGEMPPEQIPQTKAGMESYFDSLGAYLGSRA